MLEKTAQWDITPAMEAFVKMVEHRNIMVPHQATLSNRSQIRTFIDRLYAQRFKPFLRSVGINLSGSDDYVWKWKDDLVSEDGYVDLICMYLTF